MYEETYIEERVDRLETLLGNFIVSTDKAIRSVSREVSSLSRE